MSARMYIRLCTCACVRVWVCYASLRECVCVYIYLWTCLLLCVYGFLYMCACAHIQIRACEDVCMYICMYTRTVLWVCMLCLHVFTDCLDFILTYSYMLCLCLGSMLTHSYILCFCAHVLIYAHTWFWLTQYITHIQRIHVHIRMHIYPENFLYMAHTSWYKHRPWDLKRTVCM